MAEITNNVLLLGNGFDLSIGLKSKFSDYIQYVFSNINKEITFDKIVYCLKEPSNSGRIFNIFAYMHSLNVNTLKFLDDNWLILLSFYEADNLELEKLNWADMEQNLAKYVCSAMFYNDIPKNCFSNYFNSQIPHGYMKHPTINRINENEIIKHIDKFTESFVNYLNELIKKDKDESIKNGTSDLESKAWEKLECILNNISPGNNWRDNHKINSYILNFNYTNWFESLNDKNGCFITNFQVNNIHGRIDTKCIIGIDDKKVNLSQIGIELNKKKLTNKYIFSKTYRRLTNNLQNSLPLPISNASTNIIFCGLSLSENDDVYYDTIFNTYDIYNNKKVKLYFIFFKGHNLYHEMYRLLKKYGEHFGNDLQGNTLITKLSIEGRLEIITLS